MRQSNALCSVVLCLISSSCWGDLFLDLSSVTPGGPGVGKFTGTLGGVSVTGAIAATGAPSSFFFNVPGGDDIGASNVFGESKQFSYATVFSPTISTTDRVGFTSMGVKTETVSISFGAPITNPVFHFANFDWVQMSFGGNVGLSSMTLLNGNGGGGDGVDPFGIGLLQIRDITPTTFDVNPPTISPPTSGDRSAYGSVQLNGTFMTIFIGMGTLGPFVDNGSFSISVADPAAIPEPSSLMLTILGLASAARFLRKA